MENRKSRLYLFRDGFSRWLSVFSLLVLASCGGGESSPSAPSSPSSPPDAAGPLVSEGVFLDSPVAGLRYQTATLSGVTDARGVFRYREGETVAFFLQNLTLGQAAAAAVLTPVELVAGAQDETHPKVTNLCILLQTLDEDGDPGNGLAFSPAVQQAMEGRTMNLEQPTEQFITDPAVTGLLAVLNASSLSTAAAERKLVTMEQARRHMRATLNQLDRDGDGFSPSQGDCNDAQAAIHPNAPEVCGDGIDQDCSGADLACAPSENAFDSRLRELISSYRGQNGLGPLAFDAGLHDLAREHSETMQATAVMSHDGFNDRFNRSGYRTCVENVGWNYPTPEAMFEGWRNSSGHNTNMLNSRIGWAGVSRVGSYMTFFACGN